MRGEGGDRETERRQGDCTEKQEQGEGDTEALFRCARPSGVPRGPATSTGSLASQRHPQHEMRPSCIIPHPVESREAPPNSTVSVSSQRHPEQLPEVTCTSRGHFSHVQLCMTLWAIARQAPLSTGFSRQEYWSGLPFPSPGDLPDPGIEHRSPALQVNSLPSEPPESPCPALNTLSTHVTLSTDRRHLPPSYLHLSACSL